MSEFRVELTEDNTEEAIRQRDIAIERAMAKIGAEMETYAKLKLSEPVMHKGPNRKGEYVHPTVDTGRLRNSVTWATSQMHSNAEKPATAGDSKRGSTPKSGTVYVGTNVEYAPYIEFGTSRRPTPIHFIKSAVDGHMNEYLEIIEQELGKIPKI